MKTAVLFVCHVINDESMFRYNHLKNGCDKIGYDLYWAVDALAIPEEKLPKNYGINFYPISYPRFEALFPQLPFIDFDNLNIKRYHNTPFLAYHLFANDNKFKYDRIWIFEYDVCCYGEWAEFFKKYEDDNANLLCSSTTYIEDATNAKGGSGWCWSKMTPYLQAQTYNGCLSWSLMCGCRLDVSLHEKICEFFSTLPENDNSRHRFHMEFAWPTITRMLGGKVSTFFSNGFAFQPNITYNFYGFQTGMIYHPVKFGIEWKKILERIVVWKNIKNS